MENMNKKLKATERNNIITTTCSYDCGGRCLLEVHVRDNKVIKIRSKNAEGLNISACPRGLTQKNVLYGPDRLKTPLKGLEIKAVVTSGPSHGTRLWTLLQID